MVDQSRGRGVSLSNMTVSGLDSSSTESIALTYVHRGDKYKINLTSKSYITEDPPL